MSQQLVRDMAASLTQRGDRSLEIGRVPQNDGGDEQIQPACPVLLALVGAVAEAAETVEEQRFGKRIALLALVQTVLV
jgi:hypothetical protein